MTKQIEYKTMKVNKVFKCTVCGFEEIMSVYYPTKLSYCSKCKRLNKVIKNGV